MPAPKPATKPLKAKSFEAVLERTADRLRWVIARVPFDAAKLCGKRGQIKMQGEINGFAFGATLFPDGQGHHFLIVNKKLLSGGKTAAGLTAKFRLQPDTTPRITVSPPAELLGELGQSKRLLKFFESLNPSRRHEIAKWIAQCKTSDARKRRSQRFAECFVRDRISGDLSKRRCCRGHEGTSRYNIITRHESPLKFQVTNDLLIKAKCCHDFGKSICSNTTGFCNPYRVPQDSS
jgi:hypothetical protein